ncbi:MAG: hypothetical protein WC718_06800 [Phycisphaerales bacterium]
MRSLDKRRAAARYHRAEVQGETHLSQEPATPEFAPDPELGNVVVVKANAPNAAVSGAFLLALGGGMIIAAAAGGGGGSRSSSGGSAIFGQLVLGILGAMMLAGAAADFYKANQKCVFYELGAALYHKDKRLKSFRYADADEMRMHQRRLYRNGVYTGTSVTLKWSKDGKRMYSYSGSYKEIVRRGGPLTGSKQQFFAGPTDLDPVRDLAAGALSPRFVEALSRGEALELSERNSANAMGVTPASGPLNGQQVAYAAIEDMRLHNFRLHVMSGGKEVMTCPTNTTNFWPKFCAVQIYWVAAMKAAGRFAPE